MTREEFLPLLDELLELPEGTLKGPELLSDLPWDSLAIVSFMALADQHYGPVSPKEIQKCTTVKELLELAESRPR